MSLRKSGTFNARTGLKSELCSPIENLPFMPRRSPTCPQSLEKLVQQQRFAEHDDEVAELLKKFDERLKGGGNDADASILSEDQVLAVPRFLLDQAVSPRSDPMDVDKTATSREHGHDSDSGIGSSIESPIIGNSAIQHGSGLLTAADTIQEKGSLASVQTISATHTAITKSFSSTSSSPTKKGYELSASAVSHIERNIVKPILDEPSLKEFHPLIEDIPRRIGARFISNLRDLEKTLFFLAPVSLTTYLSACAVAYYHGRDVKDFSASPSSFLKFCETSIECLHTTVDLLSERDQRLPTDRPYTNNYFLDLVEQIRRYAQIMARTRAKEAAGETLDEMDYAPYVTPTPAAHSPHQMTHDLALSQPPLALSSVHPVGFFSSSPMPREANSCHSGEEVVLEGGLSSNGRPAELVRKKDGKSMSLVPEGSRSDNDAMVFKRPHDDLENEEDDEVLRSMARRRKGEGPGEVMQVCRVCRKEFKRPCDLTKHEKTHSRPWKCTEPGCRYHEVGWPTEKERDRHVNDKHSSAPKMYKCKFPPCTYSSKRESNCKQHMEKSHGWNYIRSKSNGRKKGDDDSSNTASTPATPFLATPTSANQALSTPHSEYVSSPWNAPDQTFGAPDPRFTPAPSLDHDMDRRASVTTAGSAMTLSSGYSPGGLSAMPDTISPSEQMDFTSPIFGAGEVPFGFNGMSMAPAQQFTPAMSLPEMTFPDTSASISLQTPDSSAQHLSPSGQGHMTLLDGNSAFDEGYAEMGFDQDWELFDHNAPPATMSQALFNSTAVIANSSNHDLFGSNVGPSNMHHSLFDAEASSHLATSLFDGTNVTYGNGFHDGTANMYGDFFDSSNAGFQ
jgi:hypothetical protein